MCFCPLSASASKVRRRSSLRKSPPRIVAMLDLSREVERETQSMIHWNTTGRWPLWLLLGMSRQGRNLAVAIEWKPRQPSAPRHFSLINISLRDRTMRWINFPTAAATLEALAALDAKRRPPTAPPAPAVMEGGAA